jgi:hypothetical protein
MTHYESVVRKNSVRYPGVGYSIHRMSFGRRSELLRHIREIGRKTEYLEAGQNTADKIDASLAASEIDAVYLRWGLREITGLLIDGETATHELLLERGPEDLVREILTTLRAECGLNPEESKN